MDELVQSGRIAPDWGVALAPVADRIAEVGAFVESERADGREILPARDHVFRAFESPLAGVRVLIVGQDPYPTPGHPIGLSFAVERDVRPLPRSLNNIYKELASDLGIPPAAHGDLTEWSDAGVMLLNRVLTVRAGEAASHRGKGWEAITEHAIRVLASRDEPLVAILWGKDAAALEPMLGNVPSIISAHPSPLSASRGFFGSRPFSRVNAALEAQGAAPINWQLTDETCSLF